METLYQVLTPLWKNGNITEYKYMRSNDEEGAEIEMHEDGGLTAWHIHYETNMGRGPMFYKYCRVLHLTREQVEGSIQFVREQNPEYDEEKVQRRFRSEVGRSGVNSAEENDRKWKRLCVTFVIAVVILTLITLFTEDHHNGFLSLLGQIKIPVSFALAGGLHYLARTPHRRRLRAQRFFMTGTAEEICAGLMELEKKRWNKLTK